MERASNWYEQKPEEVVVESENSKILWGFTVQCDRKIEARRPDIVFIDRKEREVDIIDVAIPSDDRVKDKELEKVEKYQLLKDEINCKSLTYAKSHCSACCYWGPWNCISELWQIGVTVSLEVIQKTALLTKKSTVPVRRWKRETWDQGL